MLCPFCFSEVTGLVPSRDAGMTYAYSTMRRGMRVPYTIAYVALDKGVSMMISFVDCDTDAIKIGDKVKLILKLAEDGTGVPMLVPCEAESRQSLRG